MPNWCNNSVRISGGNPEFLANIEERLSETAPFALFNHILPVPMEMDANGEDAYNWRVKNWGTKWDVSVNYVMYQPLTGTLEMTYETAWSPPEGIYQALVSMGFTVEATYDEPGMDFAGRYTTVDGDLFDDYIESVADAVDEATDGAFSAAEEAGDYGTAEYLRCKFLADFNLE